MKEKFETYKSVFDERTLRVLFKLESDGYFEELKSPISIGKESNVFSAKSKEGWVCLKIYRVNNCDFHRMYKYIRDDPRFKGLKNNRKNIIYAWAQREYRNLLIGYEKGINVPKPLAVRSNVLVMDFIGDNNVAAKRLKDKKPKNPKKFSEDLINNIKKMYKAGFVHGDLSEFNILNFKEKPVIIDLSHGVKLNYPGADELLERDIKNLQRYFSKNNIKINVQEVLNKIKNGI